MRKLVIPIVLAGASLPLVISATARAQVVCTDSGWTASACATADPDAGTASATAGTGQAGYATVQAAGGSAYVFADGSENNPLPASGWVAVSAGSGGATVTCAGSGSPGSSTTCP